MLVEVWIFLALFVLTIINIIVPITGSATVTPLLSLLTEPHLAIGLASFFFFLSAMVRVFVFRKNIDKKEVKRLLPVSIIFAIIGAFSLAFVNPLYLLIIIFIFTVYFFLKKIKIIKSKKENKLSTYFVGIFSGFLQGAGLAGSDLRNSYLYSKNLKIQQVHGTTAVIGGANFLVATIVRLYTNQVSLPDLTILIYFFPILVIATLIGKKILFKIKPKVTNIIILVVMISIIVLLGIKIFNLLF